MTTVFRLVTLILLVCAMPSQQALAGGDIGKGPYDIGEKFFARKDFGMARKYYRKALDEDDMRAHYRMGLVEEDAGNDGDALRHYRLFVELGRQGAQRSDALRRAGAIEERLEMETAPSAGLLEQGKSLFAKGKFREAEQVLLRAAAEEGSQPEIHFYLGEVYMELEAYDKAVSEYNKAKEYY